MQQISLEKTNPGSITVKTSVVARYFSWRIILFIPLVWLLIFFFIPFLIVFKISLSQTAISTPPYHPVIGINDFFIKIRDFSFDNYLWLLEDALYFNAFLSSVIIAALAAFLTFLIGYPIAYAIARAPNRYRSVLFMMIVIPFWTSFLIRVYAWIGILKPEGLINYLLLSTGFIEEPLIILNTHAAVMIGIVYCYLPFMVLPLYSCLEKMDPKLIDAASDLGCRPLKAFWKITFPLSRPGIIAGSFLVFIPAMGEFVIPDILGGNQTIMIGKILWNEFFLNRDWPLSSAVAILLLLFLLTPIITFQIMSDGRRKKRK